MTFLKGTPSRRQTSLSLILLIFCVLLLTQKFPMLVRKQDADACSTRSLARRGATNRMEEIPCNIKRAKAALNSKLSRQSNSVEEARQAYKKRYRRRPPRYFDVWARFALQHKSKIIDDYDQIELDMRPFRLANLDRKEWQRRISAAKTAGPGEMLGSISILDGSITSMGPLDGPMSARTLEDLLAPVAPLLPNINVLFNWYAEPRLLADRDGRAGLNAKTDPKNGTQRERFSQVTFTDLSGQPIHKTLSASCPYNALTNQASDHSRNRNNPRDFCQHAQLHPESSTWHGFFNAPDQFHPTYSLLPIFSRAKLSVFNDILAPNVCYGHTDYRVWRENDTIPFTKKRKDLYWRGSMTGLSMTETNWIHGHRHRLVRYIQSIREHISMERRARKSSFEHFFQQAPWTHEVSRAIEGVSSDVFNVGFSGFGFDCDPNICSRVKDELPLRSPDEPNEAYNHQFVLDVDGQSMSCRYYSLLESNAVVFKQTLWGEWHDDRLVPWLHYVPIDMDLSRHDIPLYLKWFLHSEKGQMYAETIAKESRKWTETALRSIDLTIYFFRILIELDAIMTRSNV